MNTRIQTAPIKPETQDTQIKLKGTKLNHQNFKRLTRLIESYFAPASRS